MVSNSSNDNTKKLNFGFTLRAEVGDPYGSIIQYYQQQSKEVSRKLIMEAASVYWGLVAKAQSAALKGLGKPSREQITDHIYQLRSIASELIMEFGVEEPETLRTGEREWLTEATEFEFYYQVYDADLFPLIEYLMDSTTVYTLSQKILRSSMALWGAKAARMLGLCDELVKQNAANGIYQLREQEKYLRNYFQYFEINQMSTVTDLSQGVQNPLVPYIDSPKPRTQEMTEIESSTPTHPEMTEEEIDAWLLHDPENDEWRSNLFKNL